MKQKPKQDETEYLLSTEANRNRLLCKDCNKSLDDCTCIEDTIELPNQALIDAAERLKGKELFKESNDRARKILSEIKSLPIQETIEEAAEKYVNSFEFGIAHPRRVCKNAFINGAKSDAAKAYWYNIFKQNL